MQLEKELRSPSQIVDLPTLGKAQDYQARWLLADTQPFSRPYPLYPQKRTFAVQKEMRAFGRLADIA
jgi:hypothetical protein